MLEVIGEIAIQPRHRCHGCGADKPEILQGWSAEFESRAVDDIMFVYLEHRFTPNFEVLETRITLRTIFRNDEGIPQDRDYRSVLVQSRVHAERLYPDTEGRNNVRYYRQPGSA